MKFNEDSRVKLPAILHLTQLGYTYLSLKESNWDENTNIFTGYIIKLNFTVEDICKLTDLSRSSYH
ncbi:hypothetical protein [Muriicola sp. Z0-33]|uniref:hypothetical protein n=1 Tax=Muriicola sp. Z0-33 TaxID=2816957 RepID=UPI002238649C|nr:hypothetical protein [Muriicola sp. Z0-33]MCW5518060.1 hypothetical protein [Muriicola sp. Z0-33]